MPEIKNNFTGGKMNKDLDERIVPNGEYRDAMNIQVSTSEGSNVGTVQNILGNALVPGQNFIGENCVSIGSVADEKNDKLYYFVTRKFVFDEDFEQKSQGWDFSSTSWKVGKNYAQAISGVGKAGYLTFEDVDIVEGVKYRLTYTIPKGGASTGTSSNQLVLANATTNASTLNSSAGSDNVGLINEHKEGTHSVDWLQGGSNTGRVRLWHSDVYNGKISSVKIRQLPFDHIIEYDTVKNLITPVFTDAIGGVLNFNPDTVITGVNIIDDLLFWTDNHSEPKKINIKDSIEGTHIGGLTHTVLINESRGIEFIDNTEVLEKHITVIKPSPKGPLGIEFPLDGDIAIVGGSLSAASFYSTSATVNQNTSSFILNETTDSQIFDLTGISVDDEVTLQLPKNIESQDDFSLDWAVGDILVIKEFDGSTAPDLPLTSWSARARLMNWSGNQLQDAQSSLITNGNFDTSMSGWGTHPILVAAMFELTDLQNWGFWYHNEGLSKMSFNTVGGWTGANVNRNRMPWSKLWQSPSNHIFIEGDTYTLTYTLSGRTGGWPSALQGRIKARIEVNGSKYDFSYKNTTGTHTEQIVLDGTSYSGPASPGENDGGTNAVSYYENKVYFQTDGNADRCLGEIDNVALTWNNAPNAQVRLKFIEIDQDAPTPTNLGVSVLQYAIERYNDQASPFKNDFFRFSYRYKYKDGEYSTFAPFSGVAFRPGNFNYHPKKGFNLGMSNKVNKLELLGYNNGTIPADVVAIDILAKKEGLPTVYVVDTIKQSDRTPAAENLNSWNANKYVLTSDTIKGALPSNQILRPWDNVPKKALAQDVTGNRIVYGNYKQGYDLKIQDGSDYQADFDISIDNVVADGRHKKSIKSQRNYQLGVVFADQFGRETPVITNKSGSFYLEKYSAKNNNILNVGFLENDYPVDMKYFKFFIKETSSEYYNLAMDRFYIDDDKNAWLSFQSSDINKIDLDTVLVLKKGAESSEMVEEVAEYKVLDIKAQAPEFIKTKKLLVEEKTHDFTETLGVNLFNDSVSNAPLEGYVEFKMNYSPFASSSGENLSKSAKGILFVEFGDSSGRRSNKYRISTISSDHEADNMALADSEYSVRVSTPFGDDVNFITDNANSPSEILDGTVVSIYDHVIDDGGSFEGRFFVKIFGDTVFDENIVAKSAVTNQRYRVVESQELFLMNRDHTTNIGIHASSTSGAQVVTSMGGHRSYITGLGTGDHVGGAYDTERVYYRPFNGDESLVDPNVYHHYSQFYTGGSSNRAYTGYGTVPFNTGNKNPGVGWNNFCQFAVFFRNYKYESDTETATFFNNNTSSSKNIGQYKFGTGDWRKEFEDYTSPGISNNVDTDYNGTYNYRADGSTNANTNGWGGAWQRKVNPNEDLANNNPNPNYNPYPEPNATTAGDTRDENSEVWFIDNGPWVASRSNDTLHWQYIAPCRENHSNGITTYSGYWKMEVGFGGLYNAMSSSNPKIFSPDNPEYQDANHQDTIALLVPQKRFRFREDPHGTTYTAIPSVAKHRLIRYASNHKYGYQTSHPNYDETKKPVPGAKQLLQLEVPQLSPNFTNRWQLKLEPQIVWNPATTGLGPIDNGINGVVLSRTSGDTADTSNINDYKIVVASNVIVNDNALIENVVITEGLLVTHYNGDGAGVETSTYAEEVVSTSITVFGTTVSNGFNVNSRQELLVRKVEKRVDNEGYDVYLTGYRRLLHADDMFTPTNNTEVRFQQPKMNGYSQNSVNRLNVNSTAFSLSNPGIMAVSYTLEVIEQIESDVAMPTNPAVFETEPKTKNDLDIYYEASGLNPVVLNEDTISAAIPLGSIVTSDLSPNSLFAGDSNNSYIPENITVAEHIGGNTIVLNTPIARGVYPQDNALISYPPNYTPGVSVAKRLKIIKPNKEQIIVTVVSLPNADASGNISQITLNPFLLSEKIVLDYYNCYSFGNGVESNRIKDLFNKPYISNGVRVSTTLETDYNEEHRKYGLIYSGIYNSNSGVNNLNQFVQAEKITKDLNPSYGSIQKLHSRDSDLVVFCEDKVLRVLANKDALFNADGNTQLTATENVLGQTVPFMGEYGISKNPESFASENYRIYFADKTRGAVLRLSKDGLTPISDAGMKDYFKDSMSTGTINLLGENAGDGEEYWDLFSTSNVTFAESSSIIIGGHNIPTQRAITGWGKYGNVANLNKDNILTVGKTYNLQFDVIEYYDEDNGGVKVRDSDGSVPSIFINNSFGNGWNAGPSFSKFKFDGAHVNVTWEAATTRFSLGQYQVNRKSGFYDGTGVYVAEDLTQSPPVQETTTVAEYIDSIRTDGGTTSARSYIYGGAVRIKNLVLKEVKDSKKILGSFDDKKNEYNISIGGDTVSFKEDVRGWVSFKSFVPESAVSCGNDYYSTKNGKIWQHHVSGAKNNSFYGQDSVNSSVNVLINQAPGVIKSFKTIDYDGSQAKVIQNLEDDQYYNMENKAGWFVSSIKTDKQSGTLNEFVEKEGKWFNYISGQSSTDAEDLDFAAFNVQGIGILDKVSSGGDLVFSRPLNASLQVGDVIYQQEENKAVKVGVVDRINGRVIELRDVELMPISGVFILFAKSNSVNVSSLVGYFANIKLENNSTENIELFSVASDITESSK